MIRIIGLLALFLLGMAPAGARSMAPLRHRLTDPGAAFFQSPLVRYRQPQAFISSGMLLSQPVPGEPMSGAAAPRLPDLGRLNRTAMALLIAGGSAAAVGSAVYLAAPPATSSDGYGWGVIGVLLAIAGAGLLVAAGLVKLAALIQQEATRPSAAP